MDKPVFEKLVVADERTTANVEFANGFKQRSKELGAKTVLTGRITQGDTEWMACKRSRT